MKKVVLSHRLHEAGMRLLNGNADVVITNSGNPQDMLPELRDAEGLIIRIGSIDRETMFAAKKLKVIGRPGVGVDDVDVAAATELGIPVVIAPGANTRSVAEHALALIFATAKDILNSDRKLRAGEFSVRNSYRAFELFGKTIGIIGGGNIGFELCRLATAVGLKVVVYDPFISQLEVERQGYQYEKNLHVLLANADIISLHVPLTEKTKNLIGEAELKLMKSTAVLINCARGGVVDEQALAIALANNQIHSAAMDVLSVEPPQPGHPLFALDNSIITPHMAGLTQEAAIGVATMAVQGVLAVINKERWPHVANCQVYDHPVWQNRK